MGKVATDVDRTWLASNRDAIQEALTEAIEKDYRFTPGEWHQRDLVALIVRDWGELVVRGFMHK